MNSKHGCHSALRAALMSSVALLSGAAWAQTSPVIAAPAIAPAASDPSPAVPAAGGTTATPTDQQVAAPPAAPAGDAGFGEIVVTARRVAENAQRVPVTVVAITPEVAARADVRDINSLQKIVPGFQGGARFPGNTIATNTYRIRGLTGIATYFGDVPADFSYNGAFFDIGNIQTLLGPQGTLFGQASNAGAIVISPRGPSNDFGGYFEVSAGNAQRKSFEGAVDIPILDDKILLRIAAKSYFVQGYVKDIFSDTRLGETNYDIGRVTLVVKPTSRLTNETIFQVEKDRNIGSAPFTISDFNMAPASQNSVGVAQAAVNGMTFTQFQAAQDYILALQKQIGPYRFQGWSLGCPANASTPVTRSKVPGPNIASVIPNPCAPSRGWAMPFIFINKTTLELSDTISLKNIFGSTWLNQRVGLQNSDNTRLILRDSNPNSVRTIKDKPLKFPNLSDEFQVIGSNLLNDRLNFVAGVFHIRNYTPDPQPTWSQYTTNLNDTVTEVRNDNETNALYAQADFKLFPRLTLTAGIRRTWDHIIQTNYVLDPNTLEITSTRGGPGTAIGDAKWKSINYTLGARYQLNRDVMFFFTNSKGHSTGGLQNVSGFEKYDPDSLTNYEIGVKSTIGLFGEWRARVNASGHYGIFDDVKVSNFILTTIPGTTGVTAITATTNAAKAKVEGADLDFALAHGRSFSAGITVAYTHNRYTEYTGINPITLGSVDLSGTPFANAPSWKYTLTGTYHLPIDNPHIGDISITADYYWTAEQWINIGKPIVPTDPTNPNSGAICKLQRTAANGYGPLSADGGWAYKDCSPAWHNLNLRIDWDKPLGQEWLRASLTVSNLTGFSGPTGVGSSYDSQGFATQYPNLPRYIYATLRASF